MHKTTRLMLKTPAKEATECIAHHLACLQNRSAKDHIYMQTGSAKSAYIAECFECMQKCCGHRSKLITQRLFEGLSPVQYTSVKVKI